jgi:4-amino-4-deoxy-L-arabinose transferase-like glycosyltransferase
LRGDKVERFPWLTISLGVAIYLAIQAALIGLAGVAGSSEAREIQVADTIRRQGEWILPLRNGVIPSKPPLYHWLVASFSFLTGRVDEFSARAVSQLSAALCLVLVAFVTYRFAWLTRADQGARHPRRAALLAAGILSLTYGFYQMGCQAMVDMTFVGCVWCALAAVVASITVNHEGKLVARWWGSVLFWLMVSVAILARGPLGAVLPCLLVSVGALATTGLRGAARAIFKPSLGWFAIFVPLTWYWLAYQRGGEPFLERQIFFENLKRFSGGDFVNSEAWWFYAPSLLRVTSPWCAVLIALVLYGGWPRGSVSYRESRWVVRWLPTILLLVATVMLSLSSGKRHSYTLPLLPLVAMQIALELSSLLERGGAALRMRLARFGRRTEVWVSGLSIFAIVMLTFAIEGGLLQDAVTREGYLALAPLFVRFMPILLVLFLFIVAGIRRGLTGVMATVWLLLVLVMSGVTAAGSVVKSHYKGFEQMGATWLATAAEGERLAVFKHPFDEYFDPLLMYVRRPVSLIPLERVGQECAPGTVYAAKRIWLDAHEGLFRGELVRIVTVRERLLAIREDAKRDTVFFRCSAVAQPRQPEATDMRDASFVRQGERGEGEQKSRRLNKKALW